MGFMPKYSKMFKSRINIVYNVEDCNTIYLFKQQNDRHQYKRIHFHWPRSYG